MMTIQELGLVVNITSVIVNLLLFLVVSSFSCLTRKKEKREIDRIFLSDLEFAISLISIENLETGDKSIESLHGRDVIEYLIKYPDESVVRLLPVLELIVFYNKKCLKP